MGKTLYCDACGQDINNGSKFYMVEKIPRYKPSLYDKVIRTNIEDTYIICADCFKEVGRRVQENNKPIDFDIEIVEEDNQDA